MFGISDVALGKFCRQHDIPTPSRGHWAKLKAGKRVFVPELPPRRLGARETITLGRSDWQQRAAEDEALMTQEIPGSPEFIESLQELTARVAKLVGKVPKSCDLKNPHRDIARLLEEDKARLEEWQSERYPSSFNRPLFASPFEQRRLRILNAILLALARVGMPSTMRGKNPSDTTVRVGDGHIAFSLDHPGHQRSNWSSASDIRRPASDTLRLSILWHTTKVDGMPLLWEDKPGASIEQSIQDITISLIVAGEMQIRWGELHAHGWLVSRKESLIEEVINRREEEERKECEQRERMAQARIDQLLQDAMTLRLANDIRTYVEAVVASNVVLPDPVPEPEVNAWAAWALEEANRIDPIRSRAFLRPVEDSGEPDEDEESISGVHPMSSGPKVVRGAGTMQEVKTSWHPNQRWYHR